MNILLSTTKQTEIQPANLRIKPPMKMKLANDPRNTDPKMFTDFSLRRYIRT